MRSLKRIRYQFENDGLQVSVPSTDYTNPLEQISLAMFSRWGQQNFFKYMRQHYAFDALVQHGSQPLPDTTRVVNPAWRALDSTVHKLTTDLTQQRARFASHSLGPGETTPEAIARHKSRQRTLLLELQAKETALAEQKAARRAESKHLQLNVLPEDQRAPQTPYPGTKMVMKFTTLRPPTFPAGQDV